MDQKAKALPPIHLFLDGPRQDEDLDAVRACRAVAEDIAAHSVLTIHSNPSNQGLYCSITRGVTAILECHDQVIVLEDDTEVCPYFVDYMTAALSCYNDVATVASIHGYLPPLTIPLPETFFLRGADCWGWATWRDRWALFRHDAAAMASEIRAKRLASAFDLGGRVPNLRMLDDRAAGRSNSWAICWHASCFLAGRYTLHPGRSLVRNIGLDHSGEHCVPSASLDAVLTDRPLLVSLQKVVEDPAIVAAFGRQLAPAPLPVRVLKRFRSAFRKLSSAQRPAS